MSQPTSITSIACRTATSSVFKVIW